MTRIPRRRFMKGAIIIGAAAAASPTVFIRKSPARWAPGTIVHPNVDQLRVVGVTDARMTRERDEVSSWDRQEELVVKKVVWENIDRLAARLTDLSDPGQAWRTIFVRPPRKSWSETVVAIKTNNIAQQHTRSAVMAKICNTLVHTIGVRPHNIHIYDGVHGKGMSRSTPFEGLPAGCRIEDDWGGITTSTAVPGPWQGSGGQSACLRHLVSGSVDILINIAMCKGHSWRFGGFTMTLKNHFGTFTPWPGHEAGDLDYLISINKTPEVLGSMDRRTGRVLYPRQQLCLVDALWASKHGPGGKPSRQPNFMAMGVLSPAVDYVLANGFRGERMGWKPNRKATERMLSSFGYSEEDLPAGGGIIEI